MKKVQIYLTDEQQKALAELATRTGRSKSELIRRAIDTYYLARRPSDLTAFRSAIEDSAGAWEDRTETGEEYVERLRRTSSEVFDRIEARVPTRLGRKAADLIREERSSDPEIHNQ